MNQSSVAEPCCNDSIQINNKNTEKAVFNYRKCNFKIIFSRNSSASAGLRPPDPGPHWGQLALKCFK